MEGTDVKGDSVEEKLILIHISSSLQSLRPYLSLRRITLSTRYIL